MITILSLFLPHISRNRPYVDTRPLSLESPSRLPLHHTPYVVTERWVWVPRVIHQCSHWLAVLHTVM